MKYVLTLLCLMALSSCMSAEERAEQARLQDLQDIETCKSYGLKEGSEAFGNCRLQIDLARQQQYYSRPYIYGGYGNYGSHIGSGIRF